MIEEQMKMLKFMIEATGRIDLNEFAHKMGLTSKQAIEHLREMATVGFLKQVGGGYTITEKGKNALKATSPVPSTMRFYFYNGLGKPAGSSAGTIEEFCDLVLKADLASLEFHNFRGDLENWVRAGVNDAALADDLANIKKHELKGEDLRNAIVKVTKTRYSL